MSKNESLRSHLEELKKKHRDLDKQVEELVHHRNVDDEIRKLKTQKLWLKDEIHRIETELASSETHLNGFS